MRFDKAKKELAQYYHACVGSPVQSSFIAAIAHGNFITWPGLSVDLIKKHLPPTTSTSKGHLRHEAQGIRSTKTKQLAKNITLQNEDSAEKYIIAF